MTKANKLDADLDYWKLHPVEFIERCLINSETGKPYVLYESEKLFLTHMFALDDSGRMLYPDLIYSAIKKSGKTVFGAILAIVTGLLYGGPYAEVYCVANNLDQAESRVFEICRRIITASPLLKREAKISNDRILFPATGATIRPLSSNYTSAAGGHPTLTIFDEVHSFTSERHRRLWTEMVSVPTRTISARLVVSHAGRSGEAELLEELYRRGLQQPELGPDLRGGNGILMFWSHVPITPEQDEKWLENMRRSLQPADYMRMIENKFSSNEASFIDMTLWDACVEPYPENPPIYTERAVSIWCGVDASVTQDATALVAVTWSSKDQKVWLVDHKIFTPSPDDPIDFEEVEKVLLDWHKRFTIKAVYFDPAQMVATSQRLMRKGVPMIKFSQTTSNLTECGNNFHDLIKRRRFATYPDDDIRLAISRAVARKTSQGGFHIGKATQAHKVDVVTALAMAALAAVKSQSDEPTEYNLDAFINVPPDDPEEKCRIEAELARQRYRDELMAQFGQPGRLFRFGPDGGIIS